MKKLLFFMLVCLLLSGGALAEEALDITRECLINDLTWSETDPSGICDGDHATFDTVRSVLIVSHEEKPIASLLIQWQEQPKNDIVIEGSTDGQVFTEICRTPCKYAQQFILLNTCVPIVRISADATNKIKVNELSVFTEGDTPAWVPQWKDAPEKVDLMLFSTHPDDEVLWFGGLLPYYAGECDKEVLVINAVFNTYRRKLELLDALWTCGVDNYPIFCRYEDLDKGTQKQVRARWAARPYSTDDGPTELIRQYKPDVVVGHDMYGEYGHVAHTLFSTMTREGVKGAANPNKHPASAKKYGLWDVPKTYLHLWRENQIHMDWHQPLAAFGGKTGIEVAEEALNCHVSQISNSSSAWRMSDVDGGEYDNGLFGLWRTTVGPDIEKNDMFENIPAK